MEIFGMVVIGVAGIIGLVWLGLGLRSQKSCCCSQTYLVLTPTNFPIRIYLSDKDKYMVCNTPQDIPSGESFKVVKCNVELNDDERTTD